MAIGVDAIVKGKVTSITKYAAFVSLEENKSGMVHISEIAYTFVNDIRDHLTEGQEVNVKVIGIDQEGRINLSIKKAMEPPNGARQSRGPARTPMTRRAPVKENLTFEDKLKQFMHDSESKISDLRHNERRNSRRRGR